MGKQKKRERNQRNSIKRIWDQDLANSEEGECLIILFLFLFYSYFLLLEN